MCRHVILVHILAIGCESDSFGVNKLLYFALEGFAILDYMFGCPEMELTSRIPIIA